MNRARSAAGLALVLLTSLLACGASQRSGRTIQVAAGQDLQAALDDARPGDTLALEAGATFVGPFTLPRKRGAGWITVRSAALDRLPPAGTRVQPTHAEAMPKLETASGAVLATERGAHHYRLIGLEIRPMRGAYVSELVRLGSDRQTRASTPAHFAIERCFVHGDAFVGTRRGVALNSGSTDVLDSHFADFKEPDADSQAIAGWNGPGPFRIVNNYLEAAGENVMFGGADPSVPGLVPSDIEIRDNHFRKPLSWKPSAGTAGRWSVKNLFELKNARRVRVEGNLFEHNWVQAQSGFAVLFTVRNQDGRAPWSVVDDVIFRRNVVRHSASGISVLGRDDNHPSQRTQRIRIEQNLFEDIGGPSWGGGGVLLQLIGGAYDVVFAHNTAFHTDNVIVAEGDPHARFVFTNNIVQQNQYGIVGTGTGPGMQTLTKYFPGAQVTSNVIVGGDASVYPPHNFFPATLKDVGLVRRQQGWPRLPEGSPYRSAGTDGSDVGAVIDELPATSAAAGSTGSQPAKREPP